jgi:hypothetical protein
MKFRGTRWCRQGLSGQGGEALRAMVELSSSKRAAANGKICAGREENLCEAA